MEVFREILQICPRLPDQEFEEPPSEQEILSFTKELGHTRKIKNITAVVVDHMHQPWRTFAAIINKCLSGKIRGLDKIRLLRAQILWGMYYKKNIDFVALLWEDFEFQIDNRDAKKQEKMYYPKLTKDIIHHFLSKDKSISMRNRMFMHTAQDDCILGTMRFVTKDEDTQVYGALIPIVMTTPKIRDSPAYQTYLVFSTGAATLKSKRIYKKPASPMIKTTTTSPEETPYKKKSAPAKKDVSLKKPSRRQYAGGSSGGVDLESEVPDKPKDKSINTSEGTGLKPRVPDVSKGDSSESEYESWRDSGDEANVQDDEDVQDSEDEPQHADDERTDSKNNDDDEETEDEFVHTPPNYVPTDDETNDESNDVIEEEYERINEEQYGDVSVSNQVKDDAQATQKTKVPLPTTTSTTADPDSKTLVALQLRVTDLEKDVKELKDVDNSTKVISTIKYEVPNAVKEYLGSSLDDALHKQYAPQKSIKDIREIKMEHARKQQVPKETITLSDTTALEEFDQKLPLNHLRRPSQLNLPKALPNLCQNLLANPHKQRRRCLRLEILKGHRILEKTRVTLMNHPLSMLIQKTGSRNLKGLRLLILDWNVGKSVDFRPPQTWISKIAQAEKPPLSFDELMSTPIEFSAYVMNHLKIDNLTQYHLVGPIFNLLKGTYRSRVELEYNIEECYKAVTDRLD
ncbi:hypothetical protein Tco_1064553 [Tanacetum coccineum]